MPGEDEAGWKDGAAWRGAPAARAGRNSQLAQGVTSMIHFVVHDEKDSVGVVVVEGVKAGQDLTGWIMNQDATIRIKALNDIPIGHKLALREIPKGAGVTKYGHDIGLAVASILAGEHAHVHNVKTRRW